MKAVKEKEQLQKTLDSWKDSSKNLWRLINSGMSSNNKLGLGYEIQSNNEVLSYEEEMNFSVFNCSKEDSVGKPLYSRFLKTNDFKGVPHPLSGDYTPTPQEEIDESLYVYGSIGTSSEHSVDPESEISSVPPEVYVSTPVTTNEKGVSDPKTKEIEPSCVSHIKTPRQPIKDQATPKVNRKNWNAMMERELGEGYSFTKKKCFVCGSLSHLIKDCDYYEKKMAREAEFKKQRVFNTGNGVSKPVWTNANRVNHANQFVPRSVQVNTGRTNINSVRPNINTGRTNVNPVRPRVNTGSSNINTVKSRQPVPVKTSNSFSPKRPQVNQFNQRRHFFKSYSSVRRPFANTTAQMSHFHAVKGNWGSAVKTSAGYNWRNSKPNSNCDSGPTFIRTVNAKGPQGRPKPEKAWWMLRQMNGNRDQLLQDFEEFNWGSCYLWRYFTNESRHTNVSFDMKDTSPTLVLLVLIAKATFDESKLWHRRLVLHKLQVLIASENKMWMESFVMASTVRYTEEKKVESRKSSQIQRKKRFLTELQQGRRLPSMSLVQAMQEELLQFKLQQVWVLVDLPHGMKVIGTKWVYINKKDERGVVVRNKARLVAEWYMQEKELTMDDVKALYGLHQAPRAWYATLSTFLEKHGYKRGTIDKTLFIKRDKKDIMLVQVQTAQGKSLHYLGSVCQTVILKKFDLVNVKTAITPMETKVALTKDEEAVDVDVHLYRSMIGSLMYLTASRPDIMYVVCVCVTIFHVTPKIQHLNAVKEIFKYL
ncbi:putative ribonuclease H-like domain-containing protein [Tanacetum coccineum]